MIIGLFSGWWTLAIIFGVLYGAAAIAGLFLVLVVGDVQAREDETLPGVWLAEIDVMSGIEFEKYVAAVMRVGLLDRGAGTDPKRSLSSDSTDPT